MTKFKLALKDGLKGSISEKNLELLPSGFQRIGDIVLFNLNEDLVDHKKEIGGFVKDYLNVKSVFRRGIISGELRKPGIERIAGNTNITIHKENGCVYKLDVTKVMFSKGNLSERGRIVAKPGEDVVDMFAGIGYFTIPIAKKTRDCRICAIEKNKDSIRFLKDNIELNNLDNIEVIHGDCRDIEINSDRILMGYFPGTEKFLDKAFSILRREGIIHYHDIYKKGELWRKPLGLLQTNGLDRGYKMETLYKKIVKQYSPCKYHVVVDAKFQKI